MVQPRFPLESAKQAVDDDRFRLGRSRALDILQATLGTTHLDSRAFVRAVFRIVTLDDYQSMRVLESEDGDDGGTEFDVYGVQVPTSLLDEYGLELAYCAWYIKFTLLESEWGEEAYFLSFHPLEKPMLRNGGWLSPHKVIRS